MEVRHNTKLLERAVELIVQRAEIPTKQAAALAAERAAIAAARRRLATGAAIAIAAVGIGLGIYLGWRPWRETSNDSTEVHRILPTPTVTATATASHTPEKIGTPAPTESHAPVFNYVKFATRTINMFGRSWEVQAGHQFATGDQKNWDTAWCYIEPETDGVPVRVALADRKSPYAGPVGPIASAETLQHVGLADPQALELATQCPWLDGREFTTGDFAPLSGRAPAPTRTSYPVPAPSAQTTVFPTQTPAVEPMPTVSATPTETPAPTGEFTVNDGYDGVGNDLPNMPVSAQTVEECENSCEQNGDCNGFTFNKKYNACFLKGRIRIIVANQQAETGYKKSFGNAGSALAPVVSQLKTQYKTAVTGVPYRGLITQNFDQCLVTCEEDRYCVGANFDSTTFECNLFRTISGNVGAPSMSSGVRALR